MESKDAKERYKLPGRIASRKKTPSIETLAQTLDVPLGYLLAGFTDDEIAHSIYGSRVKSGEICLVPALRAPQPNVSFQHFLRRLPSSESELLDLSLGTFRNQYAFSLVFQIEKIYSGLEMLLVNEPPLILWDEEDISLWLGNMKLSADDNRTMRKEFARYQSYFRELARDRKKRYKIVINYPTLRRFLERKSARARSAFVEDVRRFLSLPTFDLILYRPASHHKAHTDEASAEAEVLCKHLAIPPSFEDTISVQIKQTPPHIDPVEYFVSPLPKAKAMIQQEMAAIDRAYALALDQYAADLQSAGAITESLSKKAVSGHTLELLSIGLT